ncbi:YiiD C-terminal domain-containing protein [Algoriphagus aestuarii]|nr:YiiD C-terminal domain-containing protein [Algoriphagus aestuarii]
MKMKMKFNYLIRAINWYPPFWFSGIKVIEFSEDYRMFKVRLKLSWYNKNLVGTAFGGSLYAMCDPFFMFILMANLGSEYIVWDKYASIDFLKPGKGTVFATFSLSPEQLVDIKKKVDEQGKQIFEFPCEILDEYGTLIASLKKGVFVRRKDFQKPRD